METRMGLLLNERLTCRMCIAFVTYCLAHEHSIVIMFKFTFAGAPINRPNLSTLGKDKEGALIRHYLNESLVT